MKTVTHNITGAMLGIEKGTVNIDFRTQTVELVFREEHFDMDENEDGVDLYCVKMHLSEMYELRDWLNQYLPKQS